MRAAAGLSVLSLFSLLRVAPAAAQERAPLGAPPPEPRSQATGSAIESALSPPAGEENAPEPEPPPPPPRYTEGNIDYDVTYDDSVAQTYDDGYDPQAAAQFEETLAPYGTWVDDDVYGRIWEPSGEVVGDEFSPYATAGHWLQTEYGWTWISDYDWGWAPFHYGRWLVVAERGWCWMPGTLWGPAWVSWRAGGGYVAWAPLVPRRMSVGSPLGPGSAWRFAMATDLGRRFGYMLPQQMAPRIFGRMSVVSNAHALPIPGARVRVNAGPTIVGKPPAGGAAEGPTRLASVAPRALPRLAIAPHAGTPAASRPWVRAAVTGRFADSYEGRRSGDPHPGTFGEPPSLRRGSAPPRVFPSGTAPGGRRTGIHGAPSAMIVHVAPGGYRGPTFRAAPAIAPHSAFAPPSRVAAPAPTRSFSGGRFYGNGYSFGSHTSSSGARSTGSFSGGSSFSRGSSFGGSSFGARSFGTGAGHSFGGRRR
jgi:uncharacterized membrane protein YgcG